MKRVAFYSWLLCGTCSLSNDWITCSVFKNFLYG